MTVTYGKQWFRAKKCLTEIWNETKAQAAHSTRTLYTVVIGNLSKPHLFVEFNRDYVGVGFFDERTREVLSYSFDEVEPNRLFLSIATYREFAEDTDHVSRGTTYLFSTDGRTITRQDDALNGERIETESHADLLGNWEPYPEFGKYGSVIRRER